MEHQSKSIHFLTLVRQSMSTEVSMDAPQFQIIVQGELSWVLLKDFDNSGRSATTSAKITVQTCESIEYAAFQSTVNSAVHDVLSKRNAGQLEESTSYYKVISYKIDGSIRVGYVSPEIAETFEHTKGPPLSSN